MKKILIIIFLLFSVSKLYSQNNFIWDIVVDSLPETQNELYSKTKLFIGEMWISAQDVIQTDEKEAGIVLIKGTTEISRAWMTFTSNRRTWIFKYTIKFFVKDSKCRIILEDLRCTDAWDNNNVKQTLMPVSTRYPEQNGKKITGVNEDQYYELMRSLRTDLQRIVDSYTEYMRKSDITNDKW
ncbi:MAG TPA: DUF4468 domain-containing protein [Bacteroidales bacterium]|nr:DUF4468 domain-containing protein [Bacteroidales bacterium]